MWTSKLMWIVWPAFLSACVLELVVFSLVDPLELQRSGLPLGWSRQLVYTAAFFIFWGAGLLSGALTTLLGTAASPIADPGLHR
jgi:hypothetical protein